MSLQINPYAEIKLDKLDSVLNGFFGKLDLLTDIKLELTGDIYKCQAIAQQIFETSLPQTKTLNLESFVISAS